MSVPLSVSGGRSEGSVTIVDVHLFERSLNDGVEKGGLMRHYVAMNSVSIGERYHHWATPLIRQMPYCLSTGTKGSVNCTCRLGLKTSWE